jgi:hypothetical protein
MSAIYNNLPWCYIDIRMAKPLPDITGQRFGRWIVLEQDLSRGYVPGGLWHVKCDCGNEKSVRTRMLREKLSQSCGCFQRERVAETGHQNRTHGEDTKSPEYRAWSKMKNRCYNKKDKRYREWGGKGIRVCDRWLNSYPNFLEDVGRKPSRRHSLGRINNNGHYTPENTRWETPVQQAQNRGSRIHAITIDGVTDSMSQQSLIHGWDNSLFLYHFNKGRNPQDIADYLRFGGLITFTNWLLYHKEKTSESK